MLSLISVSLFELMMNWKLLFVMLVLLLFTNEILSSVKNVKDEQKIQRPRQKPHRRVSADAVVRHRPTTYS